MTDFNYEKNTRIKYQDKNFARRYKEDYTTGFSFMKLSTQRVKKIVQKCLIYCNLSPSSIILDMPCGTGVLADILQKKNVLIIASDISMGMMNFASEDYKGENFYGFIQADATKMPFKNNTFELIINIGLMHRVPTDIKRRILKEMTSISNQYIIVSFSIHSLIQRLKLFLIKIFVRHHKPSPCPIKFKELKSEINKAGLDIVNTYYVLPILSSQVVFLLKKRKIVKDVPLIVEI